MERDGAYDQRQLQTQLRRPRNINTNLEGVKRAAFSDKYTIFFDSKVDSRYSVRLNSNYVVLNCVIATLQRLDSP